ncbi:MAG TPA: DUF4142 domain-containing protein [Flavisolibacter sp.]|nr:DUF4142 domain-containing protein [Flavisolibacter sp.]
MKKKFAGFGLCLLTVLCSCNDGANTTASGTDTAGSPAMNDTMNTGSGAGANNTSTMSGTPITREDSMFVMEAAAGGMMEVEAGNLAQQNGANQRVKDYGAMMVRDHGRANDELKSFASSRGMTLPASLPPDMQKHLEDMRKMTGKSFDQHYVSMMVDHHNKDITKFRNQSTGGGDAELKAWAGKTLPVLQMHKDSIDAIRKMKM